MVKDRLAEFQTRVRDDFEDVELGRIDHFERRIDDAFAVIEVLSNDVDNLKRKQQQILSLPIVEPRHKNELESAISAIREKTRQLRPRVQEIEDEMMQMMRNNASETQLRIKRNQVEMLRRKMHSIISSFNDSQVEYRERVSKRVKRSLELAGERMNEEEVDRMLASHSSQVFYREVNPLSVAGRIALEDATARHEELLELERSLSLLQEMFQDMHDLVHSQGEMVDNIDKNVEETVVQTEQAKTNIKQAVVYKQAATRKKIMCILLIVCLILILIAVAIVLGVVLSGKK
ncbi:hypothetical protein PFISCL1PPCAC_24354 [Pristionchus fissidentatus]|uniref:t-SNARE coiled-coil homology domain-containing protein n=1 Tax=Pristionchus fissidentatus TaxID=1538716 RepID=A0AAV5WTI0_9BILA|nr:hypothetical protein PFISCL1PPCAC_24354 [Pristionchus fissidentatus]